MSFDDPVVGLAVVELTLLPNVRVPADTVETRLVVDPVATGARVGGLVGGGVGGGVGGEGGGGPRSGET